MSFNSLSSPKNAPGKDKASDQIEAAPATGQPEAQPNKTSADGTAAQPKAPADETAAQPKNAPAGEPTASKS